MHNNIICGLLVNVIKAITYDVINNNVKLKKK